MLKLRKGAAGLCVLAGATLAAGAAVAAPPHAHTTTALHLRTGPGTNHAVIATIGAGNRVAVLGCLSGRSWCEIDANGRQGWAAGSYLDPSHGRSAGPPLDVQVNAYRHRNPPPLRLGEPAKGPPLKPTEVQTGLPYQEPVPRMCQIGEYPVNGSCL